MGWSGRGGCSWRLRWGRRPFLKRFACQVDPNTPDTRTVLSHLVLEMVNVQPQVEDRIPS